MEDEQRALDRKYPPTSSDVLAASDVIRTLHGLIPDKDLLPIVQQLRRISQAWARTLDLSLADDEDV